VKPQISVLTDPIPIGRYYFSEALKHVARRVRNAIKPLPEFLRSPYRGHFAVTRSLVEGLRQAQVPSTYNPRRLSELSETVIVLAGLETLRQAIALKRRGAIKKLLAGPNLVFFPSDAKDLLCASEIDICITPGPLTCRLYREDCPELAGRCESWPAGVDTDYWSPKPGRVERSLILFYDKWVHGPTDDIERYITYVKSRGHQAHLLRYGAYTPQEYRDLLQHSKLFVGFSAEESQGIAWAEAWSVDVPTLFWYKDRHTFAHPRSQGRTFQTSPAPQLTDATGRFFPSLDAFTSLFAQWESGHVSCSPRTWVLENMSDTVCALRLCEIAGVRTPHALASAERRRMHG
jgi:hypothetical protein